MLLALVVPWSSRRRVVSFGPVGGLPWWWQGEVVMARGDGGSLDVGGNALPSRARRVGVGVRPLAALIGEVRDRLAGFDPALTSARDCLDMVGVLTDLEHSTSGALALAARRVAQTDLWSTSGDRSAAHWLARRTGMAVADAVRLLETAEVAEAAPATMEALKHGDVSTREANATAKAEAADPQAGAELVRRAAQAGGLSIREIEQDSARIVHAASGDSEAERAEKIRRKRSLRIGSAGDGSSWVHLSGPTADIARLEATLKPIIDGIFGDARRQGRREPFEAYAYDALLTLADRGADGDDGGGGDRYRNAKVIVRADLAALDRGHTEPGEVCEVAGHGPIAVAEAWRIIDGGAFVAGIVADGTDIAAVQHLGRKPTALQRTVLEWETAGTCAVEGCTNRAAIEIDHVEDWADTHLTHIEHLAALCRTCHAKKTYESYRLGPRLPNGTRKLIPPRPTGIAPTGGTPEASVGDGTSSPAPRRPGDALGPHDPEQPGLFDTG
jgi:hypothetical protein